MPPKRNDRDDEGLNQGRNTRPRLENSIDLPASQVETNTVKASCVICGRISLGFQCQASPCQNIVCKANKWDNGCLSDEQYKQILRSGSSFSCNSCCRKGRQAIPAPLAVSDESRGLPKSTTYPLLLIALFPQADRRDPQIDMIDIACRGQLPDYKFVDIPTKGNAKARRTAASAISNDAQPFLDRYPSARVLVIVNFHSKSLTGEVEYVSTKGSRQGEGGRLSNILSEWLTASFLQTLKGRKALKGLLLLCCGSVVHVEASRADITESLIETRVFTFSLAFTSQQFIPQHVAIPCLKFFRSCFLWEPDSMQSPKLPTDHHRLLTPAFTALCRGFGGHRNANMHTGMILLQRCMDDTVACTHFRMGLPSLVPFGLGVPLCPFKSCGESFGMRVSVNANSSINFKCQCGAVAKNIKCPKQITELDFEEIGPDHFIMPFPLPDPVLIKWKKTEGMASCDTKLPWNAATL